MVGKPRLREEVKLLCMTKGQEFEGGRTERREEEKLNRTNRGTKRLLNTERLNFPF